ncbi:hypothetical protein BaRGS_00008977 [Batillaria attramentaria]|uniref:Pterin-binding domain-containing protein n=1 Tax=Batillaria attramentaria TaxID=370345 RepID=A0ABD0LK43_9CAEN
MGILNVTPDSFSDGGLYLDADKAVAHGLDMAAKGADIIDVGGESTRPGAEPVEEEEEMRRVLPVIERLARGTDALLSVDTNKATVARAALKAGASIVNDISGLGFDPRMAGVVAEEDAALVLMHIKGTPNDMNVCPTYDDVVQEVTQYFRERLSYAQAAGVDLDRVVLDPGIGFGKTTRHNYTLLRDLGRLAELGRPILLGTSRKRFIGEAIGNKPAEERVWGTAASVACGVFTGAHIVRVHDVPEMVDVVRVTEAVVSAAQPEREATQQDKCVAPTQSSGS